MDASSKAEGIGKRHRGGGGGVGPFERRTDKDRKGGGGNGSAILIGQADVLPPKRSITIGSRQFASRAASEGQIPLSSVQIQTNNNNNNHNNNHSLSQPQFPTSTASPSTSTAPSSPPRSATVSSSAPATPTTPAPTPLGPRSESYMNIPTPQLNGGSTVESNLSSPMKPSNGIVTSASAPPKTDLKNNAKKFADDFISPDGGSRNAVVVFPVKLLLFNGQQTLMNCCSNYSASNLIEQVKSKIAKSTKLDKDAPYQLFIDGKALQSDEIVAKHSAITKHVANSSIAQLEFRTQNDPPKPVQITNILAKPKIQDFTLLVVIPTGQTILLKCEPSTALYSAKKQVVNVARDKGVDLIPERYYFATWNDDVVPKLPIAINAATKNQLTIFNDESITFQSISSVESSLKKSITPKLVMVPKRIYTFSESEQERSVAIKALIGRPLLMNDEDDEIVTFRRTMAKIRAINRKVQQNNFKAQSRVSIRIVRGEAIKKDADLLVVLVLPLNEVKKTVNVKATELADEFLSKIFNKYYQKKVPHKKATDFVLKAAGLAEYIDGHFPLSTFDYVRSSVAKNQKIELVVIERPEKIEEANETDSVTLEDDLSEDTTIRYIDSDLVVESKPWDQITAISLWDMDRNFRLKLIGIENISLYYGKLAGLMTKTDTLEEGRLSYYVTAGIYHGGTLLVPALNSAAIPMSANPRWHQWFNFGIKMKDIPRSARLCFSLYARTPKGEGNNKDTALGWVNCQLFDFKHELKTGLMSLNMYRDDKANPIGTCVPNAISNAATLYLEFDAYKYPVVFPTESSEVTSQDAIENTSKLSEKAVAEPPSNAEELTTLINKDPLFPYSESQRNLIWQNRYFFLSSSKSLPKVLASANESDRSAVLEVKRLIEFYASMSAIDALELLDSRFSDTKVREHAVECIDVLPDEELLDYLLQLVQVLKYEPYHDSPLARFLIRRALLSSRVGHVLYWYLKSEMHVQEISERYGLLLEAYLFGSGPYLGSLKKQDDLMTKLVFAANHIKQLKDGERQPALIEQLRKIEFPSKVSLPLNPSLETNGIVLDSCKYMDSKKLPLYVVFANADTNGTPIHIIFKAGDDLRQDMLTLQMIRIMDKLWKNEGLDLQLSPYGCISTGDEVGMIEVVLNSDTCASISKRAGGATAAFYEDPLAKWLQKHNPSETEYEKAVEVFVKSCAGYCVATYVLGIGDRHNDNIMVTKSGRLFHIDFGHFLGNYKKKFGFKRERAPFVLTPDFAYVMGGVGSANFKKFIDYCCVAYNIVRKHANKFINLFAMMLSTGIPELTCVEDINYLRNAFLLESTEEEGTQHFTRLIFESLNTKTTQFNNAIHILAH